MLADGIAFMALKKSISPHHFNALEESLSKNSSPPPYTHLYKPVDSLLETISLAIIRNFIARVNLRVRPHVPHALDVAHQKLSLREL